MSSLVDKFKKESEEFLKNYENFSSRKNNAAGSRCRKNAQNLKNIVQEFRVHILDEQKKNKESRRKKKLDEQEVEQEVEEVENDSDLEISNEKSLDEDESENSDEESENSDED